MASSLSNLVNNLSEGIHRIKCNYRHDKKCKTYGINYNYCNNFLEQRNMIEQNTNVCVVTKIINKFDEKLKERFFNTYKFSYHDNSKFILLLGKDVDPYEYMDDWEKFNETSLPGKENFYSLLNMEDITDADYAHAKRVCKDLK